MVVLVGESGSGKSSLERVMINNLWFHKIISYTTRSPRDGEIDGVDYYFISEKEFENLRQKDFFAECATYNGWHYGSAKGDYTSGAVAVLTPHGLRQIKKNVDIEITSFYIKVPRRDRLIKILERGDDIEETYRRSSSDVGQFDGIEDEVDFVIENRGYEKSVMDILVEIMKNISIRPGYLDVPWDIKLQQS